jgi:protein SCO1
MTDDVLAKQKRGIKLTILVMAVFILVVFALFLNKILTPRVLSPIELQVNGAIEFTQPRRFPDFELIDQQGARFDKSRLLGRWTLVFFGFTHCPDICPTTMAALASWFETLAPDIQKTTQVVLVTVDPARDDQATMAQYVPYFHRDFVGLTGDFLTIKRLATQLNVAFTKVLQGDDYTVDHSAIVALINPKGDYHAFFKPPLDAQKLSLTYGSMRNSFRYE